MKSSEEEGGHGVVGVTLLPDAGPAVPSQKVPGS